MQPYNRSSVTAAGRSVPSNLPFFFSSSPQEVHCWVQSAQTTASLWSGSDLHRLSDSFFLYVITISAWFCPAGGSDEHTAAGHTVMQHPLLDRWWATHSWHRRKPTNQCDLGSSHPADWLWFLWKSQDVKAYWNLFFLGDSYCFSVSTLLSTEVFTPLSSLTLTWIRWWVCKLRVFFLFACLFLCREISKWAKMLQDKPQDIHIHSAYWSHVWGRSNNSKYQDLSTEVQNGLNQQKFSHRNTILISENKPVLKKETKLNLK